MGDKPDNVFAKIASVKEKLLPAIEGLTDKQVRSILCHCWYYKYGRKKKELIAKEKEVYDLLLEHKISPKTAYEWFRLIDAPDHIKQKIVKCEISFNDASSRMNSWRRMISTKNGKEIMEDMKNVIGGLQWKDKNYNINSL